MAFLDDFAALLDSVQNPAPEPEQTEESFIQSEDQSAQEDSFFNAAGDTFLSGIATAATALGVPGASSVAQASIAADRAQTEDIVSALREDERYSNLSTTDAQDALLELYDEIPSKTNKDFQALSDEMFRISRERGEQVFDSNSIEELGSKFGLGSPLDILSNPEVANFSDEQKIGAVDRYIRKVRARAQRELGRDFIRVARDFDTAAEDLRQKFQRDVFSRSAEEQTLLGSFAGGVAGEVARLGELAGLELNTVADFADVMTNNNTDPGFFDQVAQAIGQVGADLGVIGTGAVIGTAIAPGPGTAIGAGVTAVGVFGSQIIDEVKATYNEVLRQTGDEKEALSQAIITQGAFSTAGALFDTLFTAGVGRAIRKTGGKAVKRVGDLAELPVNERNEIIKEQVSDAVDISKIRKAFGSRNIATAAGAGAALEGVGEALPEIGRGIATDAGFAETAANAAEAFAVGAATGGILSGAGRGVGLARDAVTNEAQAEITQQQVEQELTNTETAPTINDIEQGVEAARSLYANNDVTEVRERLSEVGVDTNTIERLEQISNIQAESSETQGGILPNETQEATQDITQGETGAVTDIETQGAIAQEIEAPRQEVINTTVEQVDTGVQQEVAQELEGQTEGTPIESQSVNTETTQAVNLEQGEGAVSRGAEAGLGISAVASEQFQPSQFGKKILEKGNLPLEAEKILIENAPESQQFYKLDDKGNRVLISPTEKLVTNRKEQDFFSKRILKDNDLREVAENLLGTKQSLPEVLNARTDIKVNLTGQVVNSLNADLTKAISEGNAEQAKDLATLIADVTQEVNPIASEAGLVLNTIGDLQNRILPKRKQTEAQIEVILNSGKNPSTEKLTDLEKKVTQSNLEKEILENQALQEGAIIESDQSVIDLKENNLEQQEKAIKEDFRKIEQDKQELETLTDKDKNLSDKKTSKALDELNQTQEEINTLIKDNNNLFLQNEAETRTLEELSDKRRELAALKGQESRVKTTQDQDGINAYNQQVSVLETEINDLRAALQEIRKGTPESEQLTKKKRKLEQQKLALNKQIDKLSREQQDIAAQKLRAIELEAEIAQLEDSNSKRAKVIEDLEKVIEAKNKHLENSVKALKSIANKITRKKESLVKQRDQLHKERRRSRGEISLETLSEGTRERVNKLLDKIEKIEGVAPESELLKSDLTAEVLNLVSSEADIGAVDLATSVWYLNILSGVQTQEANIVSASVNTNLNLFTSMLANPSAAKDIITGAVDGAIRGYTDAKQALRGKDVRSDTLAKLSVPKSAVALLRTPDKNLNPEQIKTKRAVQALTLNVGDKMIRALTATDIFLYRTAEGARKALLAKRLIDNGFNGNDGAIVTEVAEVLNNSTENYRAALDQATDELNALDLDRSDKDVAELITRRAYEIIDQAQPKELVDESRLFGAQSTFTQRPNGAVGVVANLMNKAIRGITIRTPQGDIEVLRVFVPFVDVVANVTNAAIDYSPLGFAKAIQKNQRLGDQTLIPKESIADGEGISLAQKEEAVRAMIGTTMMAGLFAIADAVSDDDDPYFAIYGAGPSNIERRKVFRESGLEPFSIKLGDNVMKYNETPLVFALAPVGNYFDSKRYDKKFDEKTALDTLGLAMSGSFKALSETGFLRGTKELFDVVTGDQRNVGNLLRALPKRLKNFSTGFIPGKGFIKSFTKLGEQELVDQNRDLYSYYIASFPGANQIGTRPRLNIFGEPVKDEDLFIGSRYYQSASEDPEFKFIADQSLTISHFPSAHRMSVSIGKTPTRSQKAELDRIKRGRKEEMKNMSDVEKFFGRLSYNHFTMDERYEIVKLAGPKIRDAVRLAKEAKESRGLSKKETQQVLDDLVKNAKIEARMDYLNISGKKKNVAQIIVDAIRKANKEF